MNHVTQVTLKTVATDPRKTMTTWLDADPRIKVGVIITLKGEDQEWRITEVFNTHLKYTIDNRGWDNNNYDKHESTTFKNRLKS